MSDRAFNVVFNAYLKSFEPVIARKFWAFCCLNKRKPLPLQPQIAETRKGARVAEEARLESV